MQTPIAIPLDAEEYDLWRELEIIVVFERAEIGAVVELSCEGKAEPVRATVRRQWYVGGGNYVWHAVEDESDEAAPDIHDHAVVVTAPVATLERSLEERIIALNGERPDEPLFRESLAAGYVWLQRCGTDYHVWYQKWEHGWTGGGECWALNPQGRRIDHAQEVERLRAELVHSEQRRANQITWFESTRAILGGDGMPPELITDAARRVVADRDRLQAENERLQERVRALDARCTELAAKRTVKEHERLAARVAELETWKEDAERRIDMDAGQIDDLQEDVQSGLRDWAADKREIDRLQARVTELEAEHAEIDDLHAASELDALSLTSELAREREQRQAAEARVAELEDQVHRYRDEAHDATQERDTISDELDSIRRRAFELAKKATREHENRLAAESQARDAQRARDELARGAAELQRQIGRMAELEESRYRMRDRIAELSDAVDAARNDLATERKAHEATRQELAEERDTHAAAVTSAQNGIGSLAHVLHSQWPRNLGANLAMVGCYAAIRDIWLAAGYHSSHDLRSFGGVIRWYPDNRICSARTHAARLAADVTAWKNASDDRNQCFNYWHGDIPDQPVADLMEKLVIRRDRWRQRYEAERAAHEATRQELAQLRDDLVVELEAHEATILAGARKADEHEATSHKLSLVRSSRDRWRQRYEAELAKRITVDAARLDETRRLDRARRIIAALWPLRAASRHLSRALHIGADGVGQMMRILGAQPGESGVDAARRLMAAISPACQHGCRNGYVTLPGERVARCRCQRSAYGQLASAQP